MLSRAPEQIAGWLKCAHPDREDYQVSHETIYRSLYIQTRGALKKELLAHLRRTRVMRRSRHHTQKTDNHGRITDAVSISERPIERHVRTGNLGVLEIEVWKVNSVADRALKLPRL